ncbi:hypothetical protein FOBRF1_009233 [Fusarium oxysporum]
MDSISDSSSDTPDSSDSESNVQDHLDDERSLQVTRGGRASLSTSTERMTRSDDTPNNPTPTDQASTETQPAHKRGRPPGSKNKNTLATEVDADGLPLSKRQKEEAKKAIKAQRKEVRRTKELQRKFKEGVHQLKRNHWSGS